MTEATERTLRVAEVFGPTIQGEGALAGLPTHFVRLGGCDYRCVWCDSLHAVLPSYRLGWARMTPAEVAGVLRAQLPARPGWPADVQPWVTLSGGNPVLQPCGPLVALLHRDGWRVALETQGSVAPAWLSTLDHLTLSPKPPSSGHTTPTEQMLAAIDAGPAFTSVKVVVFDADDYAYARAMLLAAHGAGVRHLYVSVGTPPMAPTEDVAVVRRRVLDAYAPLAAQVAEDLPMVRVLPQLHVLAWGTVVGV